MAWKLKEAILYSSTPHGEISSKYQFTFYSDSKIPIVLPLLAFPQVNWGLFFWQEVHALSASANSERLPVPQSDYS